MADPVIVYGHPQCPMVAPVRYTLNRAHVNYRYINIHQDDAGREHVREINNGFESVPTLVFTDGSTLTEPNDPQLRQKLTQLGYQVPDPTLTDHLMQNRHFLFLFGGMALGIIVGLIVGNPGGGLVLGTAAGFILNTVAIAASGRA